MQLDEASLIVSKQYLFFLLVDINYKLFCQTPQLVTTGSAV